MMISMMTIDRSEKPQEINLDCNTRAKIVIRTKLPPPTKRPVGPAISVFTPKKRIPTQPNGTQHAPLGVPPPLVPESPTTTTTTTTNSLEQSLSPQPTPKLHAKTIEDSKIKKLRTSISPPRSMGSPEKNIVPLLVHRTHNTSSSVTTTPTPEPQPVKLAPSPTVLFIPTPGENRPSPGQYAEEYDNCPCSSRRVRGRPPCDRCHLMILADRFCDLIDVQCEKWGIPHK